MLHTGSHYIMGATHTECQDFTLHGKNPIPHIIVCDGCSSSLGSHVGAKILAKTAQYLIQQNNIPNYHDFGEYIIQKSQRIVSKMGLLDCVLDSTLLVGFVQNDVMTVYMYGDGCILYEKTQGGIESINIEFADNTPYYLTYWLQESYQQAYASRGEDLMYIHDSQHPQDNPYAFAKPLVYHFPLVEYKTIALASDGATSCVNLETGFKEPLANIATQLLCNMEIPILPNFVEQHVLSMKQHYAKQHIRILDDLAVSMLTQTFSDI